MDRSVNVGELLESERWKSFLESTAIGLHLKLFLISQDEKIIISTPSVCPSCQDVFPTPSKTDIRTIISNRYGDIILENGFAGYSCQLQSGHIMLAVGCLCMRDHVHFPLANRGQVAAKLLDNFQVALLDGIEGGQRALELSTLRQLNNFALSLFQGEENALLNSFDLILCASIILLNATGSWLEFPDSELPTLMIKGNENAVHAARLNTIPSNAITVDIIAQNVHGKLGVVYPGDTRQAAHLLPLLAQECIIAIEIEHLFHLLNNRLNLVLGAVSSAVILINQFQTIIYANRQAEKLMRRTTIELLGSSITHWKGPWLTYLNSETDVPVRGEMEPFNVLANPANPCWVDWQLSPLLEGSTIMGRLLLLDDRTDYYRWLEAARQAERFATTSTMVGALAHELRNPISAAKGLMQLMGRKRDPEQTRNYSDLVLRELDRVTRLLNEFLLLGKPANIESKPIDPIPFLSELLPIFQGEAIGLNVEIELDIEPMISPLAADPGQLTQVLLNLVRNAVQAIDGFGKVTIRLREHDDFVRIDVMDTGPGLSSEALDNLFRPFFTTKERGTGLGLAVVQAIIHNHGGKITASNQPEGGAIFSLSFPPAKTDKILSIDVLIAVKDHLFTFQLEQTLASAGIKVMTFPCLELAMEATYPFCPSVIITESLDDQKSNEQMSACRSKWPKAKILSLISSSVSSIQKHTHPDALTPEKIESVNYLPYPVELTRVISTTRRMLAHKG